MEYMRQILKSAEANDVFEKAEIQCQNKIYIYLSTIESQLLSILVIGYR
jgi:hypothetical protein